MKFKTNGYSLTVTREPEDKKYYGKANGAGESKLLHQIKIELNKRGFDLIKKRMWKDGHLVDDLQQYLRPRNKKSPGPHIDLYNCSWTIAGLEEEWNRKGEVAISILPDTFNVQPNCYKLLETLLPNE